MNQHSTFEDCQLKDFQDENGCIYLFGYGSLLWNVLQKISSCFESNFVFDKVWGEC